MEDLKQENERLKECIQELTSDNLNTIQEMDNERRRVEQLKEVNEKLQEILQEIKAIAETGMHCEGMGCDFMPEILDLITKTEVE